MPEPEPLACGASDDGSLAELVAIVRRFAEGLPSALLRDHDGSLGPALLEEARALGLYGLAIPETYGGAGLGLGEVGVLVAELARVDRSLATSVGLHNGLGSRALVEAGSPELRSRYLPSFASGACIGAFGATEPAAGSDLSAIRTTATTEDAAIVVSGEKAYVTNAGLAGVFTVIAKSGDAGGGTTALLVPRDTAGLTLGAEEHKLGLRASSTRSVFLDRARVPLDHRLGREGRGILEAHRSLEWGRTLMSAGCLGTARAALERTLEHAAQRKQFRRALRSFGAVRAHLATMTVAVVAIETLLGSVAEEEARGDSIEASSTALKVLASELAGDACDRAVQVHGALGYVEDAGIALLLRDARVTRIFEGANDVLLVRLGTALLAGQGLVARQRPASDPDLDALHERLAAKVTEIQRSQGVAAVAHQRLLVALARADVWLHTAYACLARRDAIGRACARTLCTVVAGQLEDVARALADERTDATLVELLDELAPRLVRPNAPRAPRASAARIPS